MPSAIHIHFPAPGKKVLINILQGHDNPIEHFSNLTWGTQMKGEILLFSFNVLFYHTTQSCQLPGWFCTVHHSLLAFCKLFISVWMEKTSGYHCEINTVRFPKRELHQRKFSLVWADKFHANNSLFRRPILRLPLVAWSILGLLHFSAPGFSGSRKSLYFKTSKKKQFYFKTLKWQKINMKSAEVHSLTILKEAFF